MLRRRLDRYVGMFVAVLAAGAPLASSAQTKEPTPIEMAQTLFDKASAEMDQGRYAPACKKLEEVTRLVPDKIGGIETLGECYEKLGKLASAWGAYSRAAVKAREQGQAERAETSEKQAAGLTPRISKLRLYVPQKMQGWRGLVIKRNGMTVPRAEWDTAILIDGGETEIEATAPGYKPFRKTIQVAKEGAKVHVVVGPFEVDPSDTTAAVEPAIGAPAVTPEAKGDTRSWQTPLGIASLIVGGAGLSLGSVLGGLAIEANNMSNPYCIAGNRCDAKGFSLRNEALAFGNTSTGLIVAGGALAAAGLALAIIAPRQPEIPKRPETTKDPKSPDKGPPVLKPPAVILKFAGNGIWLQGAW